jgi:hypothetical protein
MTIGFDRAQTINNYELNRKVFSLFRKGAAESVLLRMSGRLFQSFGNCIAECSGPRSLATGGKTKKKKKTRLGTGAQASRCGQ